MPITKKLLSPNLHKQKDKTLLCSLPKQTGSSLKALQAVFYLSLANWKANWSLLPRIPLHCIRLIPDIIFHWKYLIISVFICSSHLHICCLVCISGKQLFCPTAKRFVLDKKCNELPSVVSGGREVARITRINGNITLPITWTQYIQYPRIFKCVISHFYTLCIFLWMYVGKYPFKESSSQLVSGPLNPWF